jgi:hypothetical protein
MTQEVFIILDAHDEQKLAQLERHEDRIEHLLRVLIHEARRREERLMAELDNLNTAIANVGTAVDTAIAKIDALKATPAGVDPAAVQAAADAAQAAADKLNAASA